MQTNMHEAKTNLSQLVDAALNGEEVIIAKAGKPMVQLVPLQTKPKRCFGQFQGHFVVASDFDDEAVNQDIADLFGGS